MKTKINPWWLIPVALVAGLAFGFIFFSGPGEETAVHDHANDGAEAITYTCSMHPQIRQNEPGQCPICGMDLIPVSDSQTEEGPAITLSPAAIRLGNIQTIQVGFSGTPEETLTLNGRVLANENEIRSQSSHVGGRVERLFVNTVGEEVRRGQRIATLYSPELIAAQQELLQAAEMSDSQPRLLEAARAKLRSLRLSDAQIEAILSAGEIRNTMDIHAEWSGTVTEKLVNVGDHVVAGDVLYVVADLSTVWVEFDAYESDLPLISVGDPIRFTVSGIPGQTFSGTVSFIDPVVDPRTRVAQVRVEVRNEGQQLKPQMFAKGTVQATPATSENRLLVPRSAVLWTGQRSVVYLKDSTLAQGGAAFSMHEVVLGPAIGEYYVVESGLAPGAEIVANGAFTVDAAAQLAGKPSMMNATEERLASATLGSAPEPFREQAGQLITAYTELKNSLVESDFERASQQVTQLSALLNGMNEQVLDDPWQQWWNPVRRQLLNEISEAKSAVNIDALRASFITLSESMVKIGKVVSPMENPIYVMRCPMANNNQGARWLSFENEIRNPYYGDMMLTCGSVTETITN